MAKKIVFSDHINNVFSNFNTSYEDVKNLMLDLALGREMFDAEGNKINKADAEKTLRDINLSFFGLDEKFTEREFHRAMRDHKHQWFDVVEEVIDIAIDYGMREDEIFNNLVNYRSRALGQDNVFMVNDPDIILSIARVGVSHHDYILQRPAPGAPYSVPVKRWGAAVGMDLNRYLAGQEDWDRLVGMLVKSFIVKQQVEIYNQAISAASLLPVTAGFVDSGAVNLTNKPAIFEIADNVSAANDGAPVVAIGTKNALRQFTNIVDVDWATPEQKVMMTNTGRLGMAEGIELVEIPQRFTDSTLTTKLFDDTKILFFAKGLDNKMIDFFTYGETEIDEIVDKGEAYGRIDDLGKYEIQMTWGSAVKVRRMFGQWTITT